MRVIFIFIAMLFFSVGVRSQHHHFFYIQSEQQQPFYIRMGKEVLSSSSGGFLIIPKLKDSAYEMIVGFPKNQFPEYLFKIPQVKKDRGLSLKNFGEKGWGLFDMQSMEIQMGEKILREESKSVKNKQPITSDAFTAILASVIDDPGLLGTELVRIEPMSNPMARNAVVKDVTPTKQVTQNESIDPEKTKPEKKEILVSKDPVPVVIIADSKNSPLPGKDSVVAVQTDAAQTQTVSMKQADSIKIAEALAVKEIPEQAPAQDSALVVAPVAGIRMEEKAVPHIDKLSEQFMDSTMELVFADHHSGDVTDTIRVILNCRGITDNQDKEKAVTEPVASAITDSTQSLAASQDKAAEIGLAASTVPEKNKTGDSTLTTTRKNTRAACKRVAQDKEVTALRRRMVALKDEDDMVTVALKDFKLKCYTTEQVRSISFVFVRDEGRYKLLDAAYPYVYDQDAYSTLESLLSDPYFIHRFKALLKAPTKPVP